MRNLAALTKTVNMQLRFYAKRYEDSYVVLNPCSNTNIPTKWSIEDFKIDSEFCEVKYLHCNDVGMVYEIVPLNVEVISPAALRAANDYNLEALTPPATLMLNRPTLNEIRELIQEIKDRMDVYGTDFVGEMSVLLDKYPLEVEQIQNHRFIKKVA